jgi:hypothetical protein
MLMFHGIISSKFMQDKDSQRNGEMWSVRLSPAHKTRLHDEDSPMEKWLIWWGKTDIMKEFP